MHHYGSQTWFLCVNLVREPMLLCVFILEAKTSSLAPPTGNTVNKTTTTTTTDRKVAFMIRLQKSGYRTHKETNRPRVWINIYCQSVYCDVYGGKVRTLKFRQQWDKCNMSSHERMWVCKQKIFSPLYNCSHQGIPLTVPPLARSLRSGQPSHADVIWGPYNFPLFYQHVPQENKHRH